MASGEMAALIGAHDWESSGIGPRAVWPRELTTIVDLLLASDFPMIVLWGPDLVQIYNDGYREIMAGKHPPGSALRRARCGPKCGRSTTRSISACWPARRFH